MIISIFRIILFTTLWLLFVSIMSCSTFRQTIHTIDYKELHSTLEGTFIDTINPTIWKPFELEIKGDKFFYLPNGKTMALLSFKGIVSSPDMENYLNNIIKKLLAFSPVSGVKSQVVFVGDDAFGAVQATPDGTIILPLRLISETESEDEIAWLLGHELSHIILTHHDSDWAGKYHEKLNASFSNMLQMADKYVDAAKQFGARGKSSELNDLAEIYHISSLIHEVSEGSIFPAWKREQEDEADLLGMDLVAKAGYSIDESDVILTKLGQWAKNSEANRKALFDKYQEQYEQQKSELKSDNTITNRRNRTDFIAKGFNSFKNFIKISVDHIRYHLNQTHKDIDLRQKNLLQYAQKAYQNIEVDPDFEDWTTQIKKRSTRKLISAYKNAWLAEQSFHKDDMNSALSHIRKALQVDSTLSQHSYPRFVFNSIRTKQGKLEYAYKSLIYALESPYPSVIIYRLAITSNIRKKQFSNAKRILDRAWKAFDKPPILYPFQIKLSKLIGNKYQADKFLSECKERNIENNIKKECQIAFDKKN